MTTTVTIYPEHEFLKQLAKHLLELADHPAQVTYVSWPSPGFRVPEDVFERWESSLATGDDGEPSMAVTYSTVRAEDKVVLTHTNPVTKADIEVAAVREAAEEPKELAKTKKKPGPKPKTTLIEEGQ